MTVTERQILEAVGWRNIEKCYGCPPRSTCTGYIATIPGGADHEQQHVPNVDRAVLNSKVPAPRLLQFLRKLQPRTTRWKQDAK